MKSQIPNIKVVERIAPGYLPKKKKKATQSKKYKKSPRRLSSYFTLILLMLEDSEARLPKFSEKIVFGEPHLIASKLLLQN